MVMQDGLLVKIRYNQDVDQDYELLSYDNINWCSTKKRLDTHLHEHVSIYIERGEIYASCSPLTSYFTELNINDFIKNH